MYARRSETPCCFFVGVPTESSIFYECDETVITPLLECTQMWSFSRKLFFFGFVCDLFSLFLLPRRHLVFKTFSFVLFYLWIKALLLESFFPHFYSFLPTFSIQKKVLSGRFCPQKRKRSGKKYLSIHKKLSLLHINHQSKTKRPPKTLGF